MAETRFINGFGPRVIALGVLGLSAWGLYGLSRTPGSSPAMAATGINTEAFAACIATRGLAFDQLYEVGQMTKEQLVTAKARLAPVCRLEAGGS